MNTFQDICDKSPNYHPDVSSLRNDYASHYIPENFAARMALQNERLKPEPKYFGTGQLPADFEFEVEV